ncbi:MAG: outer membrane beta-barrel protein, partial [Alphaproteobacteria bacterium]|nr:outer membrane beta-barrel protein [Alphaproteobacteria bacterium]
MAKMFKLPMELKPSLTLTALVGMAIMVLGLTVASSHAAKAQFSLRIEGHYPFAGDTSDLFNSATYIEAYSTPKLRGELTYALTGNYQVNEYLGIGLRAGQYRTKYSRSDKLLGGPATQDHAISTLVIMPELNGHYWIDDEKSYGIYGALDAGYYRNKFDYATLHFDNDSTALLINVQSATNHKSTTSGIGSGLEFGFEYNGYDKQHESPTIGYFIGTRIDWLGSFQNGVTFDM